MVGKAGLKAGLIGIGIMLVMTVIGQVLPLAGALTYVLCGINSLIYAGIGVLGAYFLTPPRTPGKGAGAGAIAGVISAVVTAIIGFIINSIRMASGVGMPGLDPAQMQQLAHLGLHVQLLMLPGIYCSAGVGAGAAAVGGAILGAIKSD